MNLFLFPNIHNKMPPKTKAPGKLARALKAIKNKPRVDEDNSDIIDFYEEDESNEQPSVEQVSDKPTIEPTVDIIEVSEQVSTDADHKEFLRVAQLENLLRAEQKKADQLKKEYAAKPKMKATDIAALIKESIATTIKEQLESELSKRDKAKLERQALKEQKKAEAEAKKAEREAELEAKRQQLESEKLAAKEKRAKEKEAKAKLELARMKEELELGIKARESALTKALSIQVGKARSSVLLS